MEVQANLMERLASPENLLDAWKVVRSNIPQYRRANSGGPDGVTIADYERELQARLSALRHMLLKGRYRPQNPGLFTISKRDGGQRQIAILNIQDRVAQRAAYQVLEPIFEPKFLGCSFGFRPGRSVQDAVFCARRLRNSGYRWVVDGDIQDCFGSIDHNQLMDILAHFIKDKCVMELLTYWLESGILEHCMPVKDSNWVGEQWEQLVKILNRGSDWAMNLVLKSTDRPVFNNDGMSEADYAYDPYEYGQDAAYYGEYGEGEEDFPGYSGIQNIEHRILKRKVLQQMATGGLLLGTSCLRNTLENVGPKLLTALRTPMGREALKRCLLAGGGVIGGIAGVGIVSCLIYRQAVAPTIGIMQGSPLSPLLANIYLHSFDVNTTKAGFRLVRFADDWVILCPDQDRAEAAYNQAIVSLARIQLKINQEKTSILSPQDQLEWLGEFIE